MLQIIEIVCKVISFATTKHRLVNITQTIVLNMTRTFNTLWIVLMLISNLSMAQINKPSLSPRVETVQHVGLAKVELDYGQPNKQNRPVFGGLIPYNKVWRTGANASTKINIDTDVTFGNQSVPKGEYALYTIPGEKEWTVILSKNTKLWGSSGYNSKDDLVRLHVPVVRLTDYQETLSIRFENFHANGGDFIITWENTKIKIPVFVDSDALIFKEINEKIIQSKSEASAQTYFDAAQFYYHKNKDLPKAYEWFSKAIELKPGAFWYVYYKAELAYTMGNVKEAKAGISTCLEAAKNSPYGDFGYIGKCTLMLEKINKN